MPRILGGDDLDVVRVDRGDAAQLVELALEAGLLVAVPASARLSPSVKAISPLPCWSRLRFSTEALVAWTEGRLPGIFSVIDLRERDAERIVDARGAAGQDVDEVLGLCGQARARKRQGGRSAHEAARET